MVAIIKCESYEYEDVRAFEEIHRSRRLEWEWTLIRKEELDFKGRHLALIAAQDEYGRYEVKYVGKCVRGRKAADSVKQLRVTHVRRLQHPVPLSELLDAVPRHLQRHLVAEGQQTKTAGSELRRLLLERRPDVRDAVDEIEGAISSWDFGPSRAGQAVSLQRDGTLVSARMAGFRALDLAEWDPPAEELYDDRVPPLFLDLVTESSPSEGRGQSEPQNRAGRPETMAAQPALEDHLIAHDTHTMRGWLSEATDHVAWREFREHGRTLLVGNANRATAERLLGCDVIFYNVARNSMVLVQYKKLDAEKGGFYYPNSDGNLAKELRRMRALDRYAARVADGNGEQRLDANPSWIKLCHPRSVLPHTSEMIHGMYFSRRQFESLRQDARLKDGRQGAVRFGYKNVPGYLDNTLFTRLVETGQIGTTGISSDLVRQQVFRTFRGRRDLVIAALYGDEPPQAERNARRRTSK
ncbi:hypothetical protein AB0N07_13645 [Streptomyces sp. NPDC051172]|uniref:hypothetical protein n=1 Tax=Streptomyces sp. NPDC051172 TaxID=3155796 RepID=UPI00342E4094